MINLTILQIKIWKSHMDLNNMLIHIKTTRIDITDTFQNFDL